MKLVTQSPKKALKAFLKQKPLRSEIDHFKITLIALLDKINLIEKRPKDESEEHLKNDVRDFLRDTFYKDTNSINTKDKKDLVIHLDKTTNSEVGVIIEAKRPFNTNEMISADNPNKKALHELILYYFDERNQTQNNQLKQLIITNINQWYIIDANYFDKNIYRNSQIKKLYETKINDKKDNPFFYEEIAKIIAKIDIEIPCIYFDIRDYEKVLRNTKKEDDKELIALYKILSPQHLLKQITPNDSNALNEKFYKELLHIIGLEEAKENGKNIIRRKKENRNTGSLIELAIEAINTEDVLHRLPDQTVYGETKEERVFNVALELCITWINRILFLKLLEGQLITYHQGNKEHRFLNSEMVNDFDELFKLFHRVLAVNLQDRTPAVKEKYRLVPYLNSSLFEISELEDQTTKINTLDNSVQLELIGTTILKDLKKKTDKLPTLNYLFQFLDAYDFASEGTEDIQEDNKSIINASVLGKVFEKINGYKDGSIYTPAFITMYMCKQSIRLAVVQKFNDVKKWNVEKFEDLYNKIEDKKEANELINSLKICDPAVGSGHFLVSALNEIIAVKSELGILMDEHGKTLRDYEIEIINDELIITDENTNIFAYNFKNKESNRVQKTLFHEKQTIIESCLFGVDINPNSVKICRLRLWIELLKNAYYKTPSTIGKGLGEAELETLPNIDINIKCGNSLLSRFALDADLSKALKSIKYDVQAYRGFVSDYKSEKSREVKRGLQQIIDSIKNDFRTEIYKNDPKLLKLNKLSGELYTLLNQTKLFDEESKQKKQRKEQQQKLEAEITKVSTEVDEIKSNAIYKNAFEWRFEFPEVLNNKGEFEGFDIIIGNPPYFNLAGSKNSQDHFFNSYNTFLKGVDIYCLFIELSKNISSKNAHTILIVSNKWRTATYGLKTRNFLATNTSSLTIIDFDKFQIFNGVNVDSGIISFTNNTANVGSLKFKVKNRSQDVVDFLVADQTQETFKITKNNIWNLSGSKYDFIKQKIETSNKPLRNLELNINRGITTGFNDAFIINQDIKAKILKQNPKATSLIKPLLRGRDIKRYKKDESNLWIIYIPKGFTIKNNLFSKSNLNLLSEPTPRYGDMPIDEALEWFKNNYFGIWSHLVQHKNELIKRIDKGDFWWELRACSYLGNFEKDKIIFTKASKIQAFTIDVDKNYLMNTSYFFTGNNLKYLLAILNSKLIAFSFLNFYQGGGIEGEITLQAIEKIPIPTSNKVIENQLTTLVDEILLIKQQNKETKELEKKIDTIVYKLYNITTEEQKIIEGIK